MQPLGSPAADNCGGQLHLSEEVGTRQRRLSHLHLGGISGHGRRRPAHGSHDIVGGRSTPIIASNNANSSKNPVSRRARSKSTSNASSRADSKLKMLDTLLNRKQSRDFIQLDYYRCRFYGPETTYLRTITLNFETLEVSFPDGNGNTWVRNAAYNSH